MRRISFCFFFGIVASSLFSVPLLGQANICEGVRLTLEDKDVHFSSDCGENPKWRYVVRSPNSSYLEFEIGKAFTAKLKGKEFPDEMYVGCIVIVNPRYPLGCTFSPNYIGFQGRALIAPGHVGTVGLILSDRDNDSNRLEVSQELRNHYGNFDIGIDIEGKGKSFWAPCTGRSSFTIGLDALIEEADKDKPGSELSIISVHGGTQVYRNTTRLGFKECKPPE